MALKISNQSRKVLQTDEILQTHKITSQVSGTSSLDSRTVPKCNDAPTCIPLWD